MRVLGIDPGIATTGWGVVEFSNSGRPSLLDYGVIQTKSSNVLQDRLKFIHTAVCDIVTKYIPEQVAIEQLFFSKEAKTLSGLAQARGAILLTLSILNLPIYEYNPRSVKVALTGYGFADKFQIQKMVQKFLNLKDIPKPDDAADALAMAISHFNTKRF